MSYPLPSIFIESSRKAAIAERSGQVSSAVFVQLRDELKNALLTCPQAVVWTPGFSKQKFTAVDVFFDDIAGTDSDERQHRIVSLIGAAARGEDVQVRAAELIADMATRHAEFHLGDALIGEEF